MNSYYENTATRLRPKIFSELTGQEFVVSTLCNSIEKENVAPAYLFSGPRGVGKTSAARLIALALNRPEGCPVDNLSYEGSEEIRLGRSLDVIEIDGASYTSVENVRNIREEIAYAPVRFRYKIYIIDEVHMLSNSAFNALLKTIEEPPQYVVFIFATTEIHKVPATIRSRCQQFAFRLISISDITKNLQQICEQSKISYEQQALQWIAKEARGSLRDAYTLFDQVKSFSNNHITIQDIKHNLGLAGIDSLNSLFEICLKEDRAKTLTLLGEMFDRGVSIEQFVLETAEYIRNILLLKSGINAQDILGFMPEAFSEKIHGPKGFSAHQLERALALLLECYRNLRYSLNTRFEVELVFAQLCSLSHYMTPQEVVHQLETLKLQGHQTPQSAPFQPADPITPHDNAFLPAYAQAEPTQPPIQPTTQEEPTSPNTQLGMPSASESIAELVKQNQEKASPEMLPTDPLPIEEHVRIWDQVVSHVRTKNEGFALVLESADIEMVDDAIMVSFNNDYELMQYKKHEINVQTLVRRITDREITIHSGTLGTPDVQERNEISQDSEQASAPVSPLAPPIEAVKEEKKEEIVHNSNEGNTDINNVLEIFGGSEEDYEPN